MSGSIQIIPTRFLPARNSRSGSVKENFKKEEILPNAMERMMLSVKSSPTLPDLLLAVAGGILLFAWLDLLKGAAHRPAGRVVTLALRIPFDLISAS
ncbi:MAG TPA: hypothetical protein VMW77_00225 [Methanoregula sp.]|nr:hypothetical protein [Methanoregula sp.]